MKKPRHYQADGVAGFFDYFRHEVGNPIFGYPTGTGKSLIIAETIRQVCEQFPSTRILKITHDKKLIRQNFDTLLEQWPTAPAGVYSAGLRKKQLRQITYCGIDSIVNVLNLLGPVDLVFIDECHRVKLRSGKKLTNYGKVWQRLMEMNPLTKFIGYTATPYRQGQGLLTEGEDRLFTHIPVDWTSTEKFTQLLGEAWLCRLRPPASSIEVIEIENVRTGADGDYNLTDLQKAVDREEITRRALAQAVELAADRKHWLVFTAGIEHAEHVASMLETEFGISVAVSHSKLSTETQDKAEADFVSGKVQALVNNGQFTTGFDYPGIDCIIVLRHTKAAGLWVQILGRGTRPVWPARDGSNFDLWPSCYPDKFDLELLEHRLACIEHGPKPDCLVLDFAGNTKRLGAINNPRIPKPKGKGKGAAPFKECEKCWCVNHASARVCSECGEPFAMHVKFGDVAAGDALIIGDAPVVEVFPVSFITYRRHIPRDGRPPSMVVTYQCGLRSFSEWICLEHQGFAAKKSRDWWRLRDTMIEEYDVPETTDDALSRTTDLLSPTHIRVWTNKKFPEIMAHDLTGTAFGKKVADPSAPRPKSTTTNELGEELNSFDDEIPF